MRDRLFFHLKPPSSEHAALKTPDFWWCPLAASITAGHVHGIQPWHLQLLGQRGLPTQTHLLSLLTVSKGLLAERAAAPSCMGQPVNSKEGEEREEWKEMGRSSYFAGHTGLLEVIQQLGTNLCKKLSAGFLWLLWVSLGMTSALHKCRDLTWVWLTSSIHKSHCYSNTNITSLPSKWCPCICPEVFTVLEANSFHFSNWNNPVWGGFVTYCTTYGSRLPSNTLLSLAPVEPTTRCNKSNSQWLLLLYKSSQILLPKQSPHFPSVISSTLATIYQDESKSPTYTKT